MKLIWISLLLTPFCLKAQEITGNDKDEHGCIGSAGYVWSEVLQKCIRLFEEGKALEPIKKSESYSPVAYLVFSKDKKRVEVYLPDQNGAYMCSQNNKGKYENIKKNGYRSERREIFNLS